MISRTYDEQRELEWVQAEQRREQDAGRGCQGRADDPGQSAAFEGGDGSDKGTGGFGHDVACRCCARNVRRIGLRIGRRGECEQ